MFNFIFIELGKFSSKC